MPAASMNTRLATLEEKSGLATGAMVVVLGVYVADRLAELRVVEPVDDHRLEPGLARIGAEDLDLGERGPDAAHHHRRTGNPCDRGRIRPRPRVGTASQGEDHRPRHGC